MRFYNFFLENRMLFNLNVSASSCCAATAIVLLLALGTVLESMTCQLLLPAT